jgi:hypothetical protein
MDVRLAFNDVGAARPFILKVVEKCPPDQKQRTLGWE